MEKSIINKLKIESALKSDWADILTLLKESKMDFWLDKDQDHKDFYKILDRDELICSFALLTEKNETILRHFTLKKSLQGKGYGKALANNLLPDFLAKNGIKTVYLLCDNKEPYVSYRFWVKTRFTVLDNSAVVPEFFQKYMDKDSRDNPDYVPTRYSFCLKLS